MFLLADDSEAKPGPRLVDQSIVDAAAADQGGPQPGAPGGQGAAPGAPPPGAAPIDYEAEARDLVAFARQLFVEPIPVLHPIYTDEVCGRLAAVTAPLMRKYGWSLNGAGPEVMFAIVTVPLAVATIAALREEKRKTKNAAQQKAPAAPGFEAGQSNEERFPGLA